VKRKNALELRKDRNLERGCARLDGGGGGGKAKGDEGGGGRVDSITAAKIRH
jgi:hypothetical protein